MVNCSDSFTDQPKVINGFSDLMVAVFGEKGKHARSAVGMNALPMNMAVEIEMIVENAVGIAKEKKHEIVLTEHVLLALIRHAPFRKTLEKNKTLFRNNTIQKIVQQLRHAKVKYKIYKKEASKERQEIMLLLENKYIIERIKSMKKQ